jgi:hypothetical protein
MSEVPKAHLGQRLRAIAEANGLRRTDLRVSGRRGDPYFLDSPANHRDGQWFAAQVTRFRVLGRTIHLRGLHYIISGASVRLPDGTIYENNLGCWEWLQDNASKAARWLEYTEFEDIHDARNEDPIWLAPDGPVLEAKPNADRTLWVTEGDASEIIVPDLDDLIPRLTGMGSTPPPQAFRLGIIGEKSSLNPVVAPIAERYAIDVVLDTGDASDTHLFEMAKRAAEDGRPFVVFYLSDFDPDGHRMPVTVARKFQALCDLRFPGLDLRLYPVALTLEQCIKYDLPSVPLKETVARKDKWEARFGRGQTELDALMALHPGVLEELLEDAIQPFFDPTLDQRYYRAIALPRRVREWFEDLPEYQAAAEEITDLHTAAVNATNKLASAVADHSETVRQAVENAPDAPKLKPVNVTPNLPETPAPLFHSRDDWLTATLKLQARRDGEDDDEGGVS